MDDTFILRKAKVVGPNPTRFMFFIHIRGISFRIMPHATGAGTFMRGECDRVGHMPQVPQPVPPAQEPQPRHQEVARRHVPKTGVPLQSPARAGRGAAQDRAVVAKRRAGARVRASRQRQTLCEGSIVNASQWPAANGYDGSSNLFTISSVMVPSESVEYESR